MRTLTLIALLTLISCSKEETPQPKQNATNTPLSTTNTTTYYNSFYVGYNLNGKWSIYKHTYIGVDTTYEIYTTQPHNTLTLTNNLIQYNMDTPEAYTYSNYNIQSSSYNYYVKDMDQPSTWMYVLDSNIILPIGIDTVYYSLARVQ